MDSHCLFCTAESPQVVCASRACREQLERYTADNRVLSHCRAHDIDVLFYLRLAQHTLNGARHASLFHPCPLTFCDQKGERDFERLRNAADFLFNYFKMRNLDSFERDAALADEIGDAAYALLKFLVVLPTPFTCVLNEAECALYVDENALRGANTPSFGRSQLAQRLQYRTTLYFHGSSAERWFPILVHGLQPCSGTKLQVNGNTQGNGIYITRKFDLALSHCSADRLVGVIIPNNPHLVAEVEVVPQPDQITLVALLLIKSQAYKYDESQIRRVLAAYGVN